MYKINTKKFLVAVLIFCCLASLLTMPLGKRLSAEKNAKSYDIVLDYNEMEALAKQSEYDTEYWLDNFRSKIGINKVALIEENLQSLTDDEKIDVQAYTMDEITKKSNWKATYPDELIKLIENFDKYDVLVEIRDPEFKTFILEALENRFEKNQYKVLDLSGVTFVIFDGNSKNALYSQAYKLIDSNQKGVNERINIIGSKIMYIGLGLNPRKVEVIRNAGCEIVPRTLTYKGFNTTKFAKGVLKGIIENHASTEYLITGGEAVPGSDDGIDFIKDYIKKADTKICLIETTTQRGNIEQTGLNQLVRDLDYKAVRTFTVWNYIQNRYKFYGYEGAKEIENTFFRAVVERNIRLIYFKPIKENQVLHTYIIDFDEYREMFDNLQERLAKHGFTRGSASIIQEVKVSKLAMSFITLTLIAAVLLLIFNLFRFKEKYMTGLAFIGIVGALAARYVIPNFFKLLISFSIAVVFACLAINLFMMLSKRAAEKLDVDCGFLSISKEAVKVLLLTAGVAFLGAIFTQGPLAMNEFMLEMEIFRGVKLAQILPILYFIAVYLTYFGFDTTNKATPKLELIDIRNLLTINVKMWMILIAGILGAVGAYYILRTGHDSSLEVSKVEMLFRNYLEDHLMARPRNKEFLFAFPALMISVYMFVRGKKLAGALLGLISVIGITSIINTFMHMRTPLYLGFYRTAYSVLFGMILGILAIFGLEVCKRLWQKYIKL